MSTYNEKIGEIESSVSSILNQTYRNIEFIIIDDNPGYVDLKQYLGMIKDKRVRVIYNDRNMGLVTSLNKASSFVHGDFVARMDADDIAVPDRLEKQILYLEDNLLDIIGCDLQLIDEKGSVVIEKRHFPTNEKKIKMCIPWGNCLPHPTWLVKTQVYRELNGYRNIPNCEDYDFILRVLAKEKYSIGNLPYVGLKYRIRQNSISRSNLSEQYLLRVFIAKNRKRILDLSEKEILHYKSSDNFIHEQELYKRFLDRKVKLKRNMTIKSTIEVLKNKYFYLLLIEKGVLKWREAE